MQETGNFDHLSFIEFKIFYNLTLTEFNKEL